MLPKVAGAKVFHAGGVGLMHAMDKGRTAEVMKAAKAAGALTTADIFRGLGQTICRPSPAFFRTPIISCRRSRRRAPSPACPTWAMRRRYFLGLGVKRLRVHPGRRRRVLPRQRRHHVHDARLRRRREMHLRLRGCASTRRLRGEPRRGASTPETTVRFAQATAALNATGLGSQAGVVSYDHTMNFATTAKDPPVLTLRTTLPARVARRLTALVVAASTAVRAGAVLLVRPAVRLAVVAAKLLRGGDHAVARHVCTFSTSGRGRRLHGYDRLAAVLAKLNGAGSTTARRGCRARFRPRTMGHGLSCTY